MKFFVPLRPLLTGWLISFAGWSLVAAMMIAHSFSVGRTSWPRNIEASIRDWLLWAILTPLLFRFVTRFPISRRTWRTNVPLHVLCMILVVAGVHWWKGFLDPSLPGRHHDRRSPPFHEAPPTDGPFERAFAAPAPPSHPDLLFALSFELPIYIMIVSAAHTLYFYRRAEIRKGQLASAHLEALQSRLQPHFLFNTLNTIAGLVHKTPDKAESVLTMLSDLLRFSLENSTEMQVPLERELEFIQKYLTIMQVRYEERVQYDLQIAPDTRAAFIPTLLLQPIVENAIKYGIEPNPDGGRIHIRTAHDGNSLRLTVINTGSILPRTEELAEGTGLSNTRARLREFFGDAASLSLTNSKDVTVEIAIPFRTSK